MIGLAIWAMEVNQNVKKITTKSSKYEMLIFGLGSSWAIQVMKVDQNTRKWPPNENETKNWI